MATDKSIVQENERRYPRFANFGEMLYFSYANLQMLCAALSMGKADSFCWYCGVLFEDKSQLTVDHIFPRSKGGTNDMDNIMMVCKHCNSSKRDTDLLEWYFVHRQQFPPVPILAHYLKQIYLYAKDNDLMDKHREELEQMTLPFNFRYIPLDYPQPEYFM